MAYFNFCPGFAKSQKKINLYFINFLTKTGASSI